MPARRVVAHDLRHGEQVELALDEQGDGTVGDRLERVLVTVGMRAAQGAEQRAGTAALRAVGDVDDIDAVRRAEHTRGDASLIAKRGELHGCWSLVLCPGTV